MLIHITYLWYGCSMLIPALYEKAQAPGMNSHLYYIVGLSMLDAEFRNICVYVCD